MLTRKEAQLIAHALGDPWSTGKKRGKRYRNHYCGYEPEFDRLLELGWIKKTREGSEMSGGDPVYQVTPSGEVALDEYLASLS